MAGMTGKQVPPAITLNREPIQSARIAMLGLEKINADVLDRFREAGKAMGPIRISEQQRALLREALAPVNAQALAAGIGRESAARVAVTLADMRSLFGANAVRDAMAALDFPRVDPKVADALRNLPTDSGRLAPRLEVTVQEAAALAESPEVSEAVDAPTDQRLREISPEEARELAANLLDFVAVFLVLAAVLAENGQLGVVGGLVEGAAVLIRIYGILARKIN